MGMREGAGIYLKVHNSLGPASCEILETLTLNFCIPEQQGKQYQNRTMGFDFVHLHANQEGAMLDVHAVQNTVWH